MNTKYFLYLLIISAVSLFIAGSEFGFGSVPGDQLGAGSPNYLSTNSIAGLASTNVATPSAPGLAPSYNTPAFSWLTATNAPTFVTTNTATGFLLSTNSSCHVSYCWTASTTTSLGGSASSLITLQTSSTNSTNPADWNNQGAVGNSQAFSIAVAFGSTQNTTANIGCDVPKNWYLRLLYQTNATIGNTATNTFNYGSIKINSPGY